MPVQIHETQFHRNRTDPALCRAVCTCGWFHFGPLDECHRRASTHDIDWEPDASADPAVLAQVAE